MYIEKQKLFMLINRQIDIQIYIQIDRKIDQQIDRQIDRQIDSKLDRLMKWHLADFLEARGLVRFCEILRCVVIQVTQTNKETIMYVQINRQIGRWVNRQIDRSIL